MGVVGLTLLVAIPSWDTTAIAMVLPIITSKLGVTPHYSFWANSAVVFGSIIFLPFLVRNISTTKLRTLLYAFMALYAWGAVFLFLYSASHPSVFLVGRGLQGIGVSGIELYLEHLEHTRSHRPLIHIAQFLGSIVGPHSGAAISESHSWRWIEIVNITAMIIATVLIYCSEGVLPRDQIELGGQPHSWLHGPVDFKGLLLYFFGFLLLAISISCAGQLVPLLSWPSWIIGAPMILGVALLFWFAVLEQWQTRPLLPYLTFSVKMAVALISVFAQGFIQYRMLAYQPLFFQTVFHQSPSQAAFSILPLVLGFAASRSAEPLINRMPSKNQYLLIS